MILAAAVLLAPVTPSPSVSGTPHPPGTGSGADVIVHILSPAGVLAALLLALIIDVMRVGPEWLKDRIAFCVGLAAIREGFGGSILERWTVDSLVSLIDGGFKIIGSDIYVTQASASVVVQVLIGAVALYCIGVLLPTKATKWVGGFAKLSFGRQRGPRNTKAGPVDSHGEKYQLNSKLWACAWILGLLADLPQGGIGGFVRGSIAIITTAAVLPLTSTIFGV